MHAGPGRFTLVMMLPPHEHAAPVGQVIRHDGQPVPPSLHHRLHVVQAVVSAQVGRLQACIYLCSFLKFNDLLGCLNGTSRRDSTVSIKEHTSNPTTVRILRLTEEALQLVQIPQAHASFTLHPKVCS